MIEKYIFDFGNVFINLDIEATQRELQKWGLQSFTPEMERQNHLYEKGLISTAEFLAFYNKQIPQATPETLKTAWNKILLDFPLYRLEFLEAFSKEKDCILLSNINEMHLEYIIDQLDDSFYKRFVNCFDKVYYTHEIHLRKPDKEIYNFVLKDLDCPPETCFFVDDKYENIESARELGITCWHIHPDKEDIVQLHQKLKSTNR